MRKLLCGAGLVALAAGLGACSSSSTTGTETFSGSIQGAKAANLLNSTTSVAIKFSPLVFTGPVNTSISNASLGNSSSTTATYTFPTPAGNFVVTRTVKNKGDAQPVPTGKAGNTCYFKLGGPSGTYTVDGSKSTGQFANASGSGTFALNIVAAANLLPGNTTCSANDTGNVLAKGAGITFKGSGPLTVKS